jgi:hypothetical protein
MSHQRQGCLSGLLKLTFLNWIFNWLQTRFGFGRGTSCSGIGCGMILLLLFIILACNTIFATDWFRFGF